MLNPEKLLIDIERSPGLACKEKPLLLLPPSGKNSIDDPLSRSLLKYWKKNEVKSEDDFNCRSVVVRIWKEIDEKEGWMNHVVPGDYNWTDKQYEKSMDYNEQELGHMYSSLKSMLSYYDLNGDFDQEYYNSKMEEREKRRKEYQREKKELKKEKKSDKEKYKLWDEYKEEKIKEYNGPSIVSKGSRDLLDILKKILPNGLT